MRITGGQARGIPLTTGRAGQIRPATDRMREAVFSSLGPRVNEAVCLDLFAGTGSYGLEALSRGAASCCFVEKSPQAVAAIQQNLAAVLKSLGHPEELRTEVVRRDVTGYATGERFDIVFMDPPYEMVRGEAHRLLGLARGLCAEGGVLVFEMPGDAEVRDPVWRLLRRLGKSGFNEPSVSILERIG